MDKATQRGLILRYCKEHGSITIRDAFEKLKINSPSKRISELRLSGMYEVAAVTEEKIYASGKKTRYKRYFIKEVDA
jgi:predicted ArsR family transcriptional regulator